MSEILVVDMERAIDEAFEMGRQRFDGADVENPEDFDISHFTESAEWANVVAPKLRAMAGFEDRGYGTYQFANTVVAVDEPDDLPAVGEKVDPSYLFDELFEAYSDGAYHAVTS